MGRDANNTAGAGRATDRVYKAVTEANIRDAMRWRQLLALQGKGEHTEFEVIKSAQWRGAGDCDPEFFENTEELTAAIDKIMGMKP